MSRRSHVVRYAELEALPLMPWLRELADTHRTAHGAPANGRARRPLIGTSARLERHASPWPVPAQSLVASLCARNSVRATFRSVIRIQVIKATPPRIATVKSTMAIAG